MSELRASLADLDKVATRTDQAASLASTIRVGDGLSSVSTAMPSAAAGTSATSAGNRVDGALHKTGRCLTAYAEAIRKAKDDYRAAERETVMNFDAFNRQMGGK